MEQLLSEIQSKITYLHNKLENYKNKFSSKIEITDSEVWTNADALLLSDLLNVCNFLKEKCYNSVLENVKNNGDSVIEQYCAVKRDAILSEIPKHKSKYVLQELKTELEKLDRIVQNKSNFVDSKIKHTTSYEMVGMSLKTGLSDSARSQLNNVYLNDSLHPSYKLVSDDILNGNLQNYNKLGQIYINKKIIRELSELGSQEMMWEVSNKIDNYLNNSLNNTNEIALHQDVSNYISKFIKYRDYLEQYGIYLPNNVGNYYVNVQKFMLQIKNTNILNKIIEELSKQSEQYKSELPKEYNDIEYGFFGTISGTPGVAYYFNTPSRMQEAQNLKYLYEILAKAKEFEGKNLEHNIVEQVNQTIIDSIDESITPKSR